MTSRHYLSVAIVAALALGSAGGAVAAGPMPPASVVVPNTSAPETETQMPQAITKNAQQSLQDQQQQDDAKAKEKADKAMQDQAKPDK